MVEREKCFGIGLAAAAHTGVAVVVGPVQQGRLQMDQPAEEHILLKQEAAGEHIGLLEEPLAAEGGTALAVPLAAEDRLPSWHRTVQACRLQGLEELLVQVLWVHRLRTLRKHPGWQQLLEGPLVPALVLVESNPTGPLVRQEEERIEGAAELVLAAAPQWSVQHCMQVHHPRVGVSVEQASAGHSGSLLRVPFEKEWKCP